MRFAQLKNFLVAALLAVLPVSAALADGQVGPQNVGPMNAASVLCNPQSGPAYGFDCPLGTGLAVSASGVLSAISVDTGAKFSITSGTGACATTSTLTGGAQTGSFLCTGTAGASTAVLALPTAPHGWSCWVADVTSGVVGETVAPVAVGAASLKITIATTSDVVQFGCVGY